MPTSARRRFTSLARAAREANSGRPRSISSMWSPLGMSGLSILNGSCMTIDTRKPRILRSSLSASRIRGNLVQRHFACGVYARRQQAGDRARGERFSGPQFADDADSLAALDDDVQGRRNGRGTVRDGQPLHVEERTRPTPAQFRQGSLCDPLDQPVANEVHADRGQDDHCCGQKQRNRIGKEDIAVLEEHAAPIRRPGFDAQAKERQPSEIDQGEGEVEGDVGKDNRQYIRENVYEQDSRLRCRACVRHQYREAAAARGPRSLRCACQGREKDDQNDDGGPVPAP